MPTVSPFSKEMRAFLEILESSSAVEQETLASHKDAFISRFPTVSDLDTFLDFRKACVTNDSPIR